MAIMKVDPLGSLRPCRTVSTGLFGNVYLRDEDTGFRGRLRCRGRYLQNGQARSRDWRCRNDLA
jgi:hypothetical protein